HWWCLYCQTRFALPSPPPNGRTRLDFGLLGRFGEQPPREILSPDEGRAKATGSREEALGSHLLGHRASFRSVLKREFSMPFLLRVRSFLRNIFLAHRVESDLDEEVRSHLEMLTEENLQAGMSPHEARRAARVELGGIDQLKE